MTATMNTGSRAGNATFVAAAAIKQGSTWGTPVAVGASLGVALTAEDISGGKMPLPRGDLGYPWGQQPDIGPEKHRGTLKFDLFHGGGHGKLMSFFFGTSGSPTQTPPSTGTTYLHKLTLQNALDKFATICLAKRSGQKWWEFASAKAAKLELSGAGNERVKGSIEFLANALDRDSSTNTTTQTDAVTVPTRQQLAYAKQGTFRVNAQAGSALASTTDDVPIVGFRFTAVRPFDEPELIDGTNYMAEPVEAGECSAELEITFRDYNAETWIAAYLAKTEYKADLKLLSTYTPSGGAAMYVLLNIARMVVAEQPQAPVAGQGPIAHVVKFKLLTPASAPSGMSGLTQPFELQVLDEVSTAYLS